MANRFTQIQPTTFEDIELFAPNFEALDAALGQQQQRFDVARAATEKIPKHLKQDADAVLKYKAEMQKFIDDATNQYSTGSIGQGNRFLSQGLRQIARDWQPGGRAYAMEERLNTYNTIKESIKKQYEDNPLLQQYHVNRINVKPFDYDSTTGTYGDVTSPLGMVRHVEQKEWNEWLDKAIGNIKDTDLAKIGLSMTQLKNYDYLYQTGKITGRQYKDVVGILAGQVSDEMVLSAQQYSNASGKSVDETKFLNADGTPNMNTQIGNLIAGAAQGRQRKDEQLKQGHFTDQHAKQMGKQSHEKAMWEKENAGTAINAYAKGRDIPIASGKNTEEIKSYVSMQDNTLETAIPKLAGLLTKDQIQEFEDNTGDGIYTLSPERFLEMYNDGTLAKFLPGVSAGLISKTANDLTNAINNKQLAQQRIDDHDKAVIDAIGQEKYDEYIANAPEDIISLMSEGTGLDSSELFELVANRGKRGGKFGKFDEKSGAAKFQELKDNIMKSNPHLATMLEQYVDWVDAHNQTIGDYDEASKEYWKNNSSIKRDAMITTEIPTIAGQNQKAVQKDVNNWWRDEANLKTILSFVPQEDRAELEKMIKKGEVTMSENAMITKTPFLSNGEGAWVQRIKIEKGKEGKLKNKYNEFYVPFSAVSTPGIDNFVASPEFQAMQMMEAIYSNNVDNFSPAQFGGEITISRNDDFGGLATFTYVDKDDGSVTQLNMTRDEGAVAVADAMHRRQLATQHGISPSELTMANFIMTEIDDATQRLAKLREIGLTDTQISVLEPTLVGAGGSQRARATGTHAR